MPHIYTVRDLTSALKAVLESEFPFVWVTGQVGTVSRPGSGHLYFTVKDQDAVLNCVWFKSNQAGMQNIPPQSLQTGQALLCAGRIAVYPPRGSYQLIAELVQHQGVGSLHLQFEALKQDLAKQGFFDPERKQRIALNPARVGVITSPSGAALQDFLRMSTSRGLPCSIRIYPCLVQGEGAEESVALAFEQANLEAWADVLVLIRGGGSLEDLWTFNTKTVARAVFASDIPVVAGIGHETDQTIAGLTTDLNGATPTHTAQLIWTDREQILQDIDELEMDLVKHWQGIHRKARQELDRLEQGLSWLSPAKHTDRLQEKCTNLIHDLEKSASALINDKFKAIQHASEALSRTYSPRTWSSLENGLDALCQDLNRFGSLLLKDQASRLEHLETVLQGQNPFGPLERGYSLVTRKDDGVLLRSATQVSPGDRLDIQTQKDRIPAKVTNHEA